MSCRVSTLIILMLILSINISSQPINLIWSDLDSLKSGKYPKGSMKCYDPGLFESGMWWVYLYTPSGRAANFANYAKASFIDLDSSNWNPERFNGFVEIQVENGMRSSLPDARQVKRLVLEIADKHFEADSSEYIERHLQNAYGAETINVDGTFYFKLKLFELPQDMKIHVFFSDGGKFTRKITAKDIAKLR